MVDVVLLYCTRFVALGFGLCLPIGPGCDVFVDCGCYYYSLLAWVLLLAGCV